jgi:hypothetical protein
MKKRMFITVGIIALLVLAGLGLIISNGSR